MFKRCMWLAGAAALAFSNSALAQGEGDALARALAAADSNKLAAALAGGADPNATLAFGEPYLMHAVELQDLAMVTSLLEAGAKPDMADVNGLTSLALACERGDAAIVAALLQAGANAGKAAPDGTAPLALCARYSTGETVAALLAAGAPVAAVDMRGQSALMWAASNGNGAAMRALLDAGAVVNQVTEAGFTPLFFAIASGTAEATQMLLEAGADVQHRGPENTSALQIALYQENTKAAAMLLALANYDLTEHDRNGEQPLHVAAKLGDAALVKQLVALGADPMGTTGTARVKWVTEANFGVPPPPVPPTPPLMLAAKAGKVEAMRMLVELGADPSFVAENGANVLLAAAEGESAAALAYALELAPDANITDKGGNAALHRIAWREFADLEPMLRSLAVKGADPKLANKRGTTPDQMVDGGLSSVREIYHRVFVPTAL